ncbi:hypothetical protein KCP70_00260 [Salmonella enterica subsp. enterica]|nr:hypothetical protein KCP70_00260 [Salmonella enterica subsp. enterica]
MPPLKIMYTTVCGGDGRHGNDTVALVLLATPQLKSVLLKPVVSICGLCFSIYF